jgi:hypothetical protein
MSSRSPIDISPVASSAGYLMAAARVQQEQQQQTGDG